MGVMNVDDRHTDRVERRAASVDGDESARDADFEAALAERYRRLSLLTLDLAEEAGEAAVNFSLVDTKGVRPAFFDRRLAAMTRAIWAHRVIERLRGEGGLPKKRGGAPAARAACGKNDAGGAANADTPTEQRPDDGWTPWSSHGESGVVRGGVGRGDGVRIDILGADEAALIGLPDLSRYARNFSNPSQTRHSPAAKAANQRNSANAAFVREGAPSRPGRGESGLVGGGVERTGSVCGNTPGADEAALIDSINDDGRGLGTMIDALAEPNLTADGFGPSCHSPTRQGLTMASMVQLSENAADETQSTEPRSDDGWTPSIEFNRPSRGESEILEAGVVEREAGVRFDIPDVDATSLIDASELSRHTQISSSPPPTRHGLTMASMRALGENLAAAAQLIQQHPVYRWTPRSSRGESEILEAGVAERDVGVGSDTSDNNKPVFGPVFGRRRFFSPP